MKVIQNLPDIRTNYTIEVLKYRGVEDPEGFIQPTAAALAHPSGLCNIEKALALVFAAIQKENPAIGVLVDCDVDGYTSATIMGQYLRKLCPTSSIPSVAL